MKDKKSCVEQVEELIAWAKGGGCTLDEYIIKFSRLIAEFVDSLGEEEYCDGEERRK